MTTDHWGRTGDAAAFVESIHRIDLDDDGWLDGMIAALGALVPGSMFLLGVSGSWRDGVVGMEMRSVRASNPASGRHVLASSDQVEPTFTNDFFEGGGRMTVLSEALARGASSSAVDGLMREFGVRDGLNLTATLHTSAGGSGASVAVASPTQILLAPEQRSLLDGYAAHISAAYRLRTHGLAAAAEGVLSPDGKLLHAEGDARGEIAREALVRAVRAIERARLAERRTDPTALLEAWRAIYERRWTLIETIESDGKRLFVARVNPPASHPHLALSPREREVAALLAEGVSQKAMAYELELSPSTIAFHAANIVAKLGARSVTEAVAMLVGTRGGPPSGDRERDLDDVTKQR